MELKQKNKYNPPACTDGINCTVVELKHTLSLLRLPQFSCINCTVVELKRNIVLYASYALFCINCTVVELKQSIHADDIFPFLY